MQDDKFIEDSTPTPSGIERARTRRTFKHEDQPVLGITCVDTLCDAPAGPHRHVKDEIDLTP